jgi:hypothetical protein
VNISQLLNPIYPGDFVKRTTMAFLSAIAVFSPIVWFQPASAASIRGFSISSVAVAPNVADILDTKDDYSSNLRDDTLRDITLSTSASSGGGSTRSNVTASFGTVRASSSTRAKVYTGSSSRGDVNDSFTVRSSTLQSGTPVTLLFTLSVDGTLLDNEIYGRASAAAFFSASDPFYSSIQLNYYSPNIATSALNQVNQVLTGRINTAIGREIFLIYGLDVGSYINGGLNGVQESASADFGNTSRFFADSETAGVILTSSSGHNYASPAGASVPTPALMPGLIALGTALRRQRQKACA